MPLGTPVNKKPLTELEKKKLVVALMEKRQRGQDLDKLVSANTGKPSAWPIDENGYFIKNDGKHFTPYEDQKKFVLDVQSYFSIFVGSRGSGKSGGGAQKALRKIYDGQSGAVMNPSFENFRISTWPELRNWMPWDLVVPSQRYRSNPEWEVYKPFVMVFMNGARMYCKGLHDPDGARGPNINWLWMDEGQEDDTGMSWRIAIPSVRVGTNPQAWVTGTPRGKLHWMYKFFIEQDISEDAKKLFSDVEGDRVLISSYFGTISDNKDNLDPLYYASMMAAYPAGYLKMQELDGMFVDAEGYLGDPTWFNNKIISETPLIVKGRIRYYDLAGTEKKMIPGRGKNDPDETIGTLMSYNPPNFYIEDQIGGAWEWSKIVENIILTARLDGPDVKIWVEQEPGSGGKNQVAALKEEIQKELPGWSVEGYRPEGDRVNLANYWFSEASQGNIWMIQGDWNRQFLSQLGNFPDPNFHDDRITSVSGARICLSPIKRWSRARFLAV